MTIQERDALRKLAIASLHASASTLTTVPIDLPLESRTVLGLTLQEAIKVISQPSTDFRSLL